MLLLLVIASILFPGSPASARPLAIDVKANTYFNGQGRIGKFSWFGNQIMGNGYPNLLLGAGIWGYGKWKNRPYEKYAGLAQIETIAATGLSIEVIKRLSGRMRPDGSDRYSFPSAHTGYAFATATTLHQFYGPKIGVPAYALAVLTAVGRMQDNRHWLTDTLGGAAIGIAMGATLSKINKKLYDKEMTAQQPHGSNVQASPLIGPGVTGVTVSFGF